MHNRLWISFELKDDFLNISIEDNGIGIAKSKIINAQKGNQKPASFATSAQERRVEILNKIYRNSISLSIEEKKSKWRSKRYACYDKTKTFESLNFRKNESNNCR
jgi:sensor histidine kinase YesM